MEPEEVAREAECERAGLLIAAGLRSLLSGFAANGHDARIELRNEGESLLRQGLTAALELLTRPRILKPGGQP